MNIKKLILFPGIVLLSAGLHLTSCKKDNTSKNDSDGTESAQNNALAEAQYNDVTIMVDQASLTGNATFGVVGSNSGAGVMGGCVTVSLDTSGSPRVISIDFGATNCMCLDGRNRRGKIIATYTGQYHNEGTVINISFDNYYVNDNKINGTKTITNQGLNISGNLVYKVEVDGEIIKANNGGTITWVSTRYREWKEGAGTPINILDDVYGITGDASGTNADNKAYTITITQELIRKINCRWFESGKLELTQTDFPAVTLDYGATGCDASATVSVLGEIYPVVLK